METIPKLPYHRWPRSYGGWQAGSIIRCEGSNCYWCQSQWTLVDPDTLEDIKMNPIQELQEYIKKTRTQSVATLTEPLLKNGVWIMDIVNDNQFLSIEWSTQTGFGLTDISDDDDDARHGYGERPDEHFDTLEGVRDRINEMLI